MTDKTPNGKQIARTTAHPARSGQRSRPASKHTSNRDRHRKNTTANRSAIASDGYIYGLHAAEFALKNKARDIQAIWATDNARRKLAGAISDRGLPVTSATPRDLDKRVGADAVHQGVVIEASALPTISLAETAERAINTGQPVVLLDQVTDPHNVGAVLRSSAVFGAAAIVMTQRHSPVLGPTLAKSASGALDLMPVCLLQNLAKGLAELKQQSFAIIGLDGDRDYRLIEDGLAHRKHQPLAMVFGAEGKGLRELTRQSCDELCRIGGDGPIASLNVSNAAAIALHLAAMQRRNTG